MDVVRGILRGATAGVLASLVLTLLLAAPPPARATSALRVSVAPAVFSPNGDGTLDKAVVGVRLARAGTLTVGVYDSSGRRVATLQKPKRLGPGSRTYVWGGRGTAGPCGDGRYTVRAKLRAGRKAGAARCPVAVDTTPPVVRLTSPFEPTVFAGGGLTTELPYTVGEPEGTHLALEVYHPEAGSGGLKDALGSIEAGEAQAGGVLVWDGRAVPGAWLPSSRYCLVLVATDVAGNRGVSPPLGAAVFAPTEVKGRVVTPAGAPVQGAAVDVVGTTAHTTTGADGSFALADCPMGLRVLRAQKEGLEAGGAGARVNMSPAVWTITMGQRTKGTTYPGLPAKGAAALAARRAAAVSRAPSWYEAPLRAGRAGIWDDLTDWFESDTYRVSGRFTYHAEDGTTHLPMDQVQVVVRDYWIDSFGFEVSSDIATSSTDALGNYDFTYTDDWDDVGTPDIRVCALAKDKDGAVANVWFPLAGRTWVCQGEYWADNTSDRLQRDYVDEAPGRVVFRLLDCVREAHLKGYGRTSLHITYPGDPAFLRGVPACYTPWLDTIHIKDGNGWKDYVFHEYGHAWMYAAYNRGNGDNAWDDYEWDASDTDYDSFSGPCDPWVALREGWAQFMALRMNGFDYRPPGPEPFECDYDSGGDDARVPNSVARVLWDLYDDTATPMWRGWAGTAAAPGPRLCTEYGPFDDDIVQVAATSGAVEDAIQHVLDEHHPAAALALRTQLREYFAGQAAVLRGVDGAFYRQGITGPISEAAPHVDAGTVLVTGDRRGDAWTGTLTLWCRVTDADAPGGSPDMDRMRVRFEGCWKPSTVTVRGEWAPLAYTTAVASGPPPGQGGSGWFKATWDTTAPSPVEIRRLTDSVVPYYGLNQLVADGVVAAGSRHDDVWIRAVAFDGLAESVPVESAEFTVDNGAGPAQGVSGVVRSSATLLPIAGATVELRQGTSSVAGTLLGTVTTGADGAYTFAPAPGSYTVIAAKTGFSSNHRAVTLTAGAALAGQDILLVPESSATGSMRSTNDGFIRWARQTDNPAATFEFWYRPLAFGGEEYGLDVAEISRDYADWKGQGAHRWPIMLIWCAAGKVAFQVNESVGDEVGRWQRVVSTTTLQLGRWYHIAAQNGPQGLKLFVDGHLEGSRPSYTDGAEPNRGAAAGGWFSLGDNQTFGSGYLTALGDFKALRVSRVERYSGDFTPPYSSPADADTVILDPLAGTTNGDNRNFVPTPAGP